MAEQNSKFWSGGALDGKKQVFLTPGLVLDTFPLAEPLHFGFGAGLSGSILQAHDPKTEVTQIHARRRDPRNGGRSSSIVYSEGGDEMPSSRRVSGGRHGALSETEQPDSGEERNLLAFLATGLLQVSLVALIGECMRSL
jgi:hypothetical protein